jgi:hypothetical protein
MGMPWPALKIKPGGIPGRLSASAMLPMNGRKNYQNKSTRKCPRKTMAPDAKNSLLMMSGLIRVKQLICEKEFWVGFHLWRVLMAAFA